MGEFARLFAIEVSGYSVIRDDRLDVLGLGPPRGFEGRCPGQLLGPKG